MDCYIRSLIGVVDCYIRSLIGVVMDCYIRLPDRGGDGLLYSPH